jgi:hypothetical protein
MRAYATVTIRIPIDLDDKFEGLTGWEPKDNSDELRSECWDAAETAMQEVLKQADLYDDDYYLQRIVDECGFTIAD